MVSFSYFFFYSIDRFIDVFHAYLLEENNEAMLTNDKKSGEKKKDCFNVLPTLLMIGKDSKSGVQRHIVRAIDNLSGNGEFSLIP